MTFPINKHRLWQVAVDAALDGSALKMSCVAGPGLLVRLKLAGVAPAAVAVTV